MLPSASQTILYCPVGKLAFMPDFGARLDQAIALAGASHRSLAEELGISVQAVGQVISGRTKAMTAENTAKAARFLRVSQYWLATGEGQPQASEVQLSELEAQLLRDLRVIGHLNAQIYAQLCERIHAVAAGLAATDDMLRNKHGVGGYVDPQRAAEVLPPAPRLPAEPQQPETMLGGISGFGELDTLGAPVPSPAAKPKRRRS